MENPVAQFCLSICLTDLNLVMPLTWSALLYSCIFVSVFQCLYWLFYMFTGWRGFWRTPFRMTACARGFSSAQFDWSIEPVMSCQLLFKVSIGLLRTYTVAVSSTLFAHLHLRYFILTLYHTTALNNYCTC